MEITFLGAAGEVTGSCYLVDTGKQRLLVDCGMFQGGQDAAMKNLAALDFDVRQLDFVLLTHAHLDHCGLLPRLMVLGFWGPVYATVATVDVATIILLDSAHIQEKEAEWANRHQHGHHARRGYDEAPLYSVLQAQTVIKQLRPVAYDTPFSPAEGISVTFRDAGHILGSSIIECTANDPDGSLKSRKIVFSGDLGQPGRPVMRDPFAIRDADYLLVESTYGNRLHKVPQETEEELVRALTDTLVRKGGNVIIPAFSVGRTQELLFILTDLVRRKRIAAHPIYVDSPMAIAATELTAKYATLLDTECQELMAWHKLNPRSPPIHFVRDVEESIALNEITSGAIIISASGMCDAGRIKYHLLYNISRAECSILISGFQARGTLGRRLVDGAREVTLFGKPHAVRADIHTIGGLSAHADQKALLDWLRQFGKPPRHTFVVHGEAEASAGFMQAVGNQLHWDNVSAPGQGDKFVLD